jgi:pimeloyl-ACP methyl ester carboxylesterase
MPSEAARSPATERGVTFPSLDGLGLRGTLLAPPEVVGAAVLVHGGGVTREEGGFFGRLAAGLAGAGVASLRFDLRGHGESEGRQEDLTLHAVANDIRAAVEYVRAEVDVGQRAALVAASFAGGITSVFAARHPELTQTLVLLNPLLDYKKRFIDDKPYWHDEHIAVDAGRELTEQGFLAHSPTFRLGRPLLNEVFYVEPLRILPEIKVPTLLVHGTADTFIPVESSRDALRRLTAEVELIEIEGAQHGIAVHDDPTYADPQTQRWQASVIGSVTDWIIRYL